MIQGTYRDRANMLADFGDLFFGKKPSEAYASWFHALGMEAAPHSTVNCARTLRDADLRGDLGSIHVPTLILHGKKDEICPFELAEQLHTGIPDAHIIPFEESGHSLFHDESIKFDGELLRFISE
nr:alpha/beta hydrolase [Alteribacter salitolerans]